MMKLSIMLFAIALLLSACAAPEQVKHEQKKEGDVTASNSSSAQPVEAKKAAEAATEPSDKLKLPAPKFAEVQAALKRIYQEAVIINTKHRPSYLVGDFNGDGWQDLAVVVKPAESMLEELNSELANWIVEDPRKVRAPVAEAAVRPLPPKTAPVRIEKGDDLVAVIHGWGPAGWRNSEAKQTFLLKNAVGTAMRTEALASFLKANKGRGKLPALAGDLIWEVLGEESGFIYWTGAKYAWHRWPQ
jgi:hypothetical protein